MLILAPTAELAQQVRVLAFSAFARLHHNWFGGGVPYEFDVRSRKRVPIVRYSCTTTSMHMLFVSNVETHEMV